MPFSRKTEPYDLDANGFEAESDTIPEAAEPHLDRSPILLRDVATIACGDVPAARAAPREDEPDLWPALPRLTRGRLAANGRRRSYCDAAKMRPWEMTGERALPLCEPLEPPCEPLEQLAFFPCGRPAAVTMALHDPVAAMVTDASEEEFDDTSTAPSRDSRAERARRHEARVGRKLFARAVVARREECGGMRMARDVRRWTKATAAEPFDDVSPARAAKMRCLTRTERKAARAAALAFARAAAA